MFYVCDHQTMHARFMVVQCWYSAGTCITVVIPEANFAAKRIRSTFGMKYVTGKFY